MHMFGSSKISKQTTMPYATRADFCRVFREDMNRLYLLSFLLTGDGDLAEKCFVGGLRMSSEGNPVFKEWAHSLARRTNILNAIRMVRPRVANALTSPAATNGGIHSIIHQPEVASIIALPPFERFAFVMAVLECYSDQECSLMLGCTRGEVMEARERALRRTGEAAELRGKVISIASDQAAMQENPAASLQIFAALAASA
jgi:DNA-directed RNA polymerase specialized sigma24 family protein